MHELGLVEELVTAVEARAAGSRVSLIRVRHASTMPESALRQAFAMLTERTLLGDAALVTEPFDVLLQCPCGFDGVLGHDDLVEAWAAVCPGCGDLSRRERTAELELLEVRLADGPH
jgi:Zn finger protein HypA/HybF involved in hydrogenase expression